MKATVSYLALRRVGALALLVWMALGASGCIRWVYNRGTREERFGYLREVLVAEDGSVALKAKASYYIQTATEREVGQYDRYLIAEANDIRRQLRRRPRQAREAEILTIQANPYGNRSRDFWRAAPDRFAGRDARERDLPEQFRHNASAYHVTELVPYTFDGRERRLRFEIEANALTRTRVSWWVWPACVLVAPVDAVYMAAFAPFMVVGFLF